MPRGQVDLGARVAVRIEKFAEVGVAFGKGIALAEFCILAVNFCGIVFFVFFFPLMLAPFFGSIVIALLLVNFFLHFIVLYHSFKPYDFMTYLGLGGLTSPFFVNLTSFTLLAAPLNVTFISMSEYTLS